MPSIFDGMSSILSGVLGDAVTYLPQVGASRGINSIFRGAPIEGEGGGVLAGGERTAETEAREVGGAIGRV